MKLNTNIKRNASRISIRPFPVYIFTNDFSSHMQDYSKTLMYANDTALLLGKQRAEQLNIGSFVALNMAIQCC